jgi:mono/diheme cytochrome c family protein
MKKIVKWVGIALGGLIGIILIAGVVLSFLGGSRLNRSYSVQPQGIDIPTDEAAIERGRHLARAVTLCVACHGENLAGDTLIDEPMIATIYASNLTAGRGGVGATYTDIDYLRAIRHGVNRQGRGLMIMHSDAYNRLSAADLGAIIAYLKSLPPVDNEVPQSRGAVLGKVFVALGLFDGAVPLIPAEIIDHDAPIAAAAPAGVTPEYGQYLASIAVCSMCHGSDLKGGPPIEEGAPPGPNIAAYAASGSWSEEQFINTIRTGVTPYGKTLNADVMPWEVYAKMTDEELAAIWRYVASLGD